jgi:hypothetical protein
MAAPVAYSSPTLNVRPKITNGFKSSKIAHRELVATISGTTSFGTVAFALNPGLSATFPWLSSIANSYEQYHFHKLRFHYVTRTATTTVGSILLAPEYDAADSAPSTEVDLAMMAGAREDVSWRDQVIDFVASDMFPMGPRKFTRSGALASNLDLKTYDAGQLIVGTTDFTGTSAVGKLWVEYEVELFIPQNSGTNSAASVSAVSAYTIASNQSVTNNTSTVVAWDSAYFDVLELSNSSGALTLPSGSYYVTAVVSGNGASNVENMNAEILIDGSAVTPPLKNAITVSSSGEGPLFVCVQGVVTSTGSNVLTIRALVDSSGTSVFVGSGATTLTVMRVA